MKQRLCKHFEPLGLVLVALVLRALSLPLPAGLRSQTDATGSVRFTDSAGVLLREVRDGDGARAQSPGPGASRSLLAAAIVVAEDKRFWRHPGIDPIGVVRAALHDLGAGRMQGASTLTMQLARVLKPHPRTLFGKFEEAALALRIEAGLSKDEILTAYLTEAPFGPQLRGAEAAAQQLFGKSALALSPAEAATLASLPKAPGLYLTERGRSRLRARRDFVLAGLAERGLLDGAARARAEIEPIPQRLLGSGFAAPHLVEAVRAGRFGDVSGSREVQLTVSMPLQLGVEAAVHSQIESLRERRVSAGAAVVLENATGNVLAYVGSPDFAGERGQNDGVLALRQPGSALKPFVYALAIENGRLDAAELLPDVPLSIQGDDGVFAPQNYDGSFHGPVRAREALGNSYNVPAVWLTDRLGVGSVLGALRRFGFSSLREGASHYGAALALGDGEVRLLELAQAYAMLAREGRAVLARAVQGAPSAPQERVLSVDSARLVTDMLADRRARAAAFGVRSVLDFAYPVAAKTGTSKGFRDNVTAGFSSEVTVVTWVGNFDGSPMHDVSGIAGAGPLFHAVMELAMQGRTSARFAPPSQGRFVRAAVCALSGARAGPSCPHRIHDWVRADRTSDECTMHENVALAADGLRAGPGCAEASTKVFERYEGAYADWAESAQRTTAPSRFSPACPGAEPASRVPLHIVEPRDGARFQLDPGRSTASQEILVRVRGEHAGASAHLDGVPLTRSGSTWTLPLRRGNHELVIRAPHAAPAVARYEVR